MSDEKQKDFEAWATAKGLNICKLAGGSNYAFNHRCFEAWQHQQAVIDKLQEKIIQQEKTIAQLDYDLSEAQGAMEWLEVSLHSMRMHDSHERMLCKEIHAALTNQPIGTQEVLSELVRPIKEMIVEQRKMVQILRDVVSIWNDDVCAPPTPQLSSLRALVNRINKEFR